MTLVQRPFWILLAALAAVTGCAADADDADDGLEEVDESEQAASSGQDKLRSCSAMAFHNQTITSTRNLRCDVAAGAVRKGTAKFEKLDAAGKIWTFPHPTNATRRFFCATENASLESWRCVLLNRGAEPNAGRILEIKTGDVAFRMTWVDV